MTAFAAAALAAVLTLGLAFALHGPDATATTPAPRAQVSAAP